MERAPLPNKGVDLEAVAQVLADLEQDDEYRAPAAPALRRRKADDAQAEDGAAGSGADRGTSA